MEGIVEMEVQGGTESTAGDVSGGTTSATGGEAAPVESQETGEHGQSEYSPDYKFKFYGKEAEMDEWARAYIKDKETEDRFRGLYAKSNGFDVLRERYMAKESEYGDIQEQFQEAQQTAQQHTETLEEIRYLRDNDLAGFFKFCNIPPEKLIDHVEQHLEYLKKPEHERAVFDKAQEQSLRARELEKENQRLQSTYQETQQTSHNSEFQEYMEHDEVAGFASQYDGLVGKKGAFQQAVIDYGESQFYKTGEYIKPLEAIRAVYRQYKPFVANAGGGQAQGRAGGESMDSLQAAPQKRPAVIPNLGNGASTSPTRKVFTSIEELRKHAKSMASED